MHTERILNSRTTEKRAEREGQRESETRRTIALLAPKPIKASVGLFGSSSYLINPRQSQTFNKDYFYSNYICRESSVDETNSEVESQREIQPEQQDAFISISEMRRNYSSEGSYEMSHNSARAQSPPSYSNQSEQRRSTDRFSESEHEQEHEYSSESHLRDLVTSEQELASIFARGLNRERRSPALQIERVSNPLALELDKMNQKFVESSQESNTTLATTVDSDFKLSYREDSSIKNLKSEQFFFDEEQDVILPLEDLVQEQEDRLRDGSSQLEDSLHFANQRYY